MRECNLECNRECNSVGRLSKLRNVVTVDRGQATAEYGLVMLAAAAIAGLLLAWATSTDAVGRIMDAVVATIIEDIG